MCLQKVSAAWRCPRDGTGEPREEEASQSHRATRGVVKPSQVEEPDIDGRWRLKENAGSESRLLTCSTPPFHISPVCFACIRHEVCRQYARLVRFFLGRIQFSPLSTSNFPDSAMSSAPEARPSVDAVSELSSSDPIPMGVHPLPCPL
jgi:hypothetical protein